MKHLQDLMTGWRHDFHLHPELGFEEYQTSSKVADLLTDFGLSRFFPATEKFVMTGRTGTVRYMAPEVYLDKPYDLRSDIYSLGMIFYYVYTGKKPFLGYDVSSMEVYFKNEDMIFSTSLIKNKKFKSIVNNCIEKDISKRWRIKDLSDNFQYKERERCCIS